MATIQQTQNFPPNYYGTMVDAGPAPPPPVPPPGRNPYARRSAAIPVPPMPVMPPEGIAPVTDPASTGTAADASPTTMVLQYLKARGYTPSSENVRRALEANQRQPGVIPGLVSDRPATDAEDMAAMRAAGAGGGRGGGGGGLVREEGRWDQPTSGTGDGSARPTSAAPSSWRGPFSGPPDPTNTLTTTADQAMRYGLPNGPSMGFTSPGSPATAATSDYTRPPPMPGVPVAPSATVTSGAGSVPPTPVSDAITTAIGPPRGLDMTPPIGPASPVSPVPGLPNVRGVGAPGGMDTTPPQGPTQPVPTQPAPAPPLPTSTPEGPPPPRTSTTLRGTPTPLTMDEIHARAQALPPADASRLPPVSIAPGPRVQGAPIQPGPWAGRVPAALRGAVKGATVGRAAGPYGAAVGAGLGGIAGAAPELGPMILRNWPFSRGQ